MGFTCSSYARALSRSLSLALGGIPINIRKEKEVGTKVSVGGGRVCNCKRDMHVLLVNVTFDL